MRGRCPRTPRFMPASCAMIRKSGEGEGRASAPAATPLSAAMTGLGIVAMSSTIGL